MPILVLGLVPKLVLGLVPKVVLGLLPILVLGLVPKVVLGLMPMGVEKMKKAKSQQHPKDFPGGHPPQYYPGLPPLNFGVRMGSGVFDAVWPLTRTRPPNKVPYPFSRPRTKKGPYYLTGDIKPKNCSFKGIKSKNLKNGCFLDMDRSCTLSQDWLGTIYI